MEVLLCIGFGTSEGLLFAVATSSSPCMCVGTCGFTIKDVKYNWLLSRSLSGERLYVCVCMEFHDRRRQDLLLPLRSLSDGRMCVCMEFHDKRHTIH